LGNKKEIKAVILIILLAVTALLVHRSPAPFVVKKSRDLQTVFGSIPGYQITSRSPLTEEIIRFLDLDDYTSIGYEKEGTPVGLYIGYYFSLDKVSAAHSPLVCFPGQGWSVEQPVMQRLNINGHAIHYAEMVARLENRQELIMYWYQAGETTAPEVYKNKINAIIQKVSGKSQEHAFVRVSVPFHQSTAEQARETGKQFIAAFYPPFIAYINEPPARGAATQSSGR